MKGHILLKALEILKECALSQIDFFEAAFLSGYKPSMGNIDYKIQKSRQSREKRKWRKQELEESKKRFRNFVYQMKHDGLIEQTDKDKKFIISSKGKQKINELKNKLPDRHYKSENEAHLVIISFDIPEKLRRKRN